MIYHDIEQGSQDWHDLRLGVPTASNFSRIITAAGGKASKQRQGYIEDLIGEKLSLYLPDRAESYTNKAIRWGQECEAEARRFYKMDQNVDVTNGGFCTTDDGRFGASPDFLVGAEGCGELKCPQPGTQVHYILEGKLPDDYKAQVHGHLIVTGRKWCDFLSYAPGLSPFLIRVEPDAFTKELRVQLELFWAELEAARKKVLG